jgi:hypothetical protein
MDGDGDLARRAAGGRFGVIGLSHRPGVGAGSNGRAYCPAARHRGPRLPAPWSSAPGPLAGRSRFHGPRRAHGDLAPVWGGQSLEPRRDGIEERGNEALDRCLISSPDDGRERHSQLMSATPPADNAFVWRRPPMGKPYPQWMSGMARECLTMPGKAATLATWSRL